MTFPSSTLAEQLDGSEPKTPATPTAEVLLRASSGWDGTPYEAYPAGPPELTLLRINIPADTELNWHIHPIPSAAYIISGEVLVETRQGNKQTLLKSGDTIAAVVNVEHRARTGAVPVDLMVFYAGSEGMALSEATGPD
ncbi:cupin domain-containing protein [Pseudomonas gingeri]|uniref:cupin domain-containing protein n=1 Tax=Pseudomonas gingeri TaxID=117681 RepID=UPI0015A3C4C4|nr:cupin domain-containing protein [Pseudomonas gingeri]NVZ64990.1 cupin domain-containing protein [Pseudomonas gingeri]NVZ73633.1 cupin domain-containing protein [Pseudomonas gingeri]